MNDGIRSSELSQSVRTLVRTDGRRDFVSSHRMPPSSCIGFERSVDVGFVGFSIADSDGDRFSQEVSQNPRWAMMHHLMLTPYFQKLHFSSRKFPRPAAHPCGHARSCNPRATHVHVRSTADDLYEGDHERILRALFPVNQFARTNAAGRDTYSAQRIM